MKRLLPCRRALPLIAVALLPLSANADWKDFLRKLQDTFSGEQNATVAPVSGLSEREITDGLREALLVAARRATDRLKQRNAFLDNPRLRIPMPESLQQVEKLLRKLKQDKLADEFVATMNHAAEQAVGEGIDVFSGAIRGLSWQDAAHILQGPDDAATQYFRERTSTPLSQRMRPIVSAATEATGVTRTYKRVIDKAEFVTRYMKPEEVDLDGYITQRTLDGLFQELAAEEKRIREDPVARTSELLRKVFSKP